MRLLVIFGVVVSFVCSFRTLPAQATPVQRNWRSPESGGIIADEINFHVYTRSNTKVADIVKPDVESIIRSAYQPWKPTTISIHDLHGGLDSLENQAIVSAKLLQEDCNVIVADWSIVGNVLSYAEAVNIAPTIAATIADLLLLLNKHFAVRFENVQLVGFGLGAQVAGFVGQSTPEKVQRITGLDPAGPIYENAANVDERLSPEDAHFVEVVHTNAGGLGYEMHCGHADYYPNGGKQQPGCAEIDFSCSHSRAYELVKEMWSAENEFVATKCATMNDMSLERCKWVNVTMGESLHTAGLYYLETNGAYPFAKGSYIFELL